MQNETDWLADIDDDTQKEQYKYFMRPEPIAGLGPVTYEDDPYLGPNTPVRYGMLGNVRNAKEENKTERKIFLKPYPHERAKTAKELQGWYQDKINESAQARPRPCMTSATLTSPYAGFCLPGEALVETANGAVPIQELEPGQFIIGEVNGELVEVEILNWLARETDEGLYVLRTEEGQTIKLTGEHPIYSEDRKDYVPAKNIRIGEKVKTRTLSDMQRQIREGQKLQPAEVLSGAPLGVKSNGEQRHQSQREAEPVRHSTIQGISQEPSTVVFDIETTSENFYTRSVECGISFLVHNCPVGCSFCFPAGTLIDTPKGKRAIESIREGETVWGIGPDGAIGRCKVLASANRTAHSTVIIRVSSGEILRCTSDHPIWSITRQEWINAEDLQTGERLRILREDATQTPKEVLQQELLGQGQKTSWDSVQVLRGTDPKSEPFSLQQSEVLETSQIGCCIADQDSPQRGTTLVRGAQEEVQRQVCCSTGGNGQEMLTSQTIEGVEARTSGSSSQRDIRLPAIETGSVHLPKRSHVYYEEPVGKPYGGVPRQFERGLGVRTKSDMSQHGRVSTRLRAEQRSSDRSERVLFSGGPETDERTENDGVQGIALQPDQNDSTGDSYVIDVTEICQTETVYDIQTATENFFAEGILVHNCYVNSGHFRANHLVKVPMDYGAQVAKQLRGMRRSSAGYFSSFTEVFFELEDYYHNTQQGAQAFIDVGLPIFFLSRKLYPDWAIEQMLQNKYSYAQKSINTPCPTTWKRLSPKAAGLYEHLEDIRRLKSKGIYVSIQVNPIIPGVVTHGDVIKTLRMLAEVGTDHVIVKFVEAAHSWVKSFVEKIKKVHGPEKGGRFEELFTQNIGSQKTIEESYRLRGHDLYRREADKLGMTYATCYEYKYARDADGKVNSKTGVSIGRDYMSSDQCHGQRVPMFHRESADEMFREVEVCPPSGCLHCADDNEGEPRCGDELAGQAKGLRMKDFKTPMTFNITTR